VTGVVVIGASTGGLHALGSVLGALPAGLAAPVVLVQHRGAGGPDLLAGLLRRRTPLGVREAEDKAPLRPGCALLAPAGYHLLVEEGHVALSTDAAVRFSRPSVDLALESAAVAYGPAAVGVVLTGANDDGARGLRALRAAGGFAVVQDPAGAERPEMPRAAIAAAAPQAVVALEEIGPLIERLAGVRAPGEARR
jgi:two-component system, chemotaxis family, protein-glutamate methylesterase/glutaminase